MFTENITKVKKFPFRADWGENNLLAYCCQNYIVVVDPISVQLVTTLYGHKCMTTALSWCSMSKIKGIERGNSSILASGDERGAIIVWEVKKARKVSIMMEDVSGSQKKSIIQLKWINDDFTFLLSLSTPNILTLWNAVTRSKVWRVTLEEPVTGFSLDPFTRTTLVLPSENGWLFVINDFNTRSQPEQISKRLQVGSTPNKQPNAPNQTALRDFIFTPHMRGQLHLIARREVTTFDLALRQSVTDSTQGRTTLRGTKSDFRRIHVNESDKNLIYSVHEDGTLAAWVYNSNLFKYEPTFCDAVRGSKHGADRPGLLYATCFSPDGKRTAAVSSDGKLWIWEFMQSTSSPSKWLLTGLLEHIPSQISSIQVSPFDHLIAVGTTNGFLMVINLLTSQIIHKYEIYNLPVQGVKWISPHQILCFCYKKNSSNYLNYLIICNLLSGKFVHLKRDQSDETSFIRAVRVSFTQKYLIVLCKDRPVEVWSLETLTLLRILPFTSITALEWCPPRRKDVSKEIFFFTSTDGSLHFYRIEGDRVIADTKKPKIFAYNQICSLAWKGDRLVSGDTAGNINLWDLTTKRVKTIASHRGLVRRIQFSPEGNFILILFIEGDFVIWDLDHNKCMSQSPANLVAISIDWAGNNYPVVATNTGSVIVYDLALNAPNSNVAYHQLSEPTLTPCMLPNSIAQNLRACMENNDWQLDSDSNLDLKFTNVTNAYGQFIPVGIATENMNQGSLLIELLPSGLHSELIRSSTSTARRCLMTANYFGDSISKHFWTLALRYLHAYSSEAPLESIVPVDSNYELELPISYDLLRDNSSLLADELYNASKQDESVRKSNTVDLYAQVAQIHACLNHPQDAVNLLLETPADHPDMYLNFLHACVISAASRPGTDRDHFYSTVLFVASNLISQQKNDRDVNTGVELMILIGEGFRACKTLQDFDQWDKAARLARCVLDENHSKVILSRWADHLTSSGQLMKSIGLWMSLGLFREVIDLLHKSELDDIAALFCKACTEHGFDLSRMHKGTVLKVIQPTQLSTPSYESQDNDCTTRKLMYFIYQQYGTYLGRIGNEKLALHYCNGIIKGSDVGLAVSGAAVEGETLEGMGREQSLSDNMNSSLMLDVDVHMDEMDKVVREVKLLEFEDANMSPNAEEQQKKQQEQLDDGWAFM
ncbi:WD repeat-containing protein [Acrasis kona]|uniref:WD repeat-containing protein n=1 Tax=Acrasis kona TaxID=1008807 RepID=A0AAW2YVU0_9EUKA